MLRTVVFSVLVLAAAALVACGDGRGSAASKPATGAGGAQEITVRSNDQMRFQPVSLTVRANTPVRLTLDNTGAALPHDFTIDNAGGRPFQVVAQANSRASGEFTVPAGTYQFHCAQPGHTEAGMVGTLTAS